ncbi:hypothetical protein T06_10774 [Trichinella sp. T6]|nr:hypothetical protein T06_10774 [Trichinella sp. T6]
MEWPSPFHLTPHDLLYKCNAEPLHFLQCFMIAIVIDRIFICRLLFSSVYGKKEEEVLPQRFCSNPHIRGKG